MTERGGATIVAAAVVSFLVLVAAGLAAVGRVGAARVQATSAADAAALAAAPLTFLPGDPAAEAATYARVNGADLVRCGCRKDLGLGDRVVTVQVEKPVKLPIFGEVTVRARAAAEFSPRRLLGGEG